MSDNLTSKQDLADSFGKAAKDYDQAAHLQKTVGSKLCALLEGSLDRSVECVMDLGCGTGFFGERISIITQAQHILFADISSQMIDVARERVSCSEVLSGGDRAIEFLVMDAEQMTLERESCDVIFSSLALQWADDLSRALKECERVLKPGGMLIYSTLLDQTLFELKASWASVDEDQHVNSFLDLDASELASSCAGFESLVQIRQPEVLEYDSPMQLMRDLKAIGAHNISSGRARGLTGKDKLKKMMQAYEGYRREDNKVPATYCVGYFVLKKKGGS